MITCFKLENVAAELELFFFFFFVFRLSQQIMHFIYYSNRKFYQNFMMCFLQGEFFAKRRVMLMAIHGRNVSSKILFLWTSLVSKQLSEYFSCTCSYLASWLCCMCKEELLIAYFVSINMKKHTKPQIFKMIVKHII